MKRVTLLVVGVFYALFLAAVSINFLTIAAPVEANHLQTYPTTMGGQCVFTQQYFSQVNCSNTPGNPEQCANPPSFTMNFAQSHSDLLVQYSTINYGHGPLHCSSVGVDIYMDGVLISNTPFIAPESVSPWINFGPVSAGNHVFTVQGTGTPGGCNSGTLSSWGGTLNFADGGICPAQPTPTCSTNAQCGSSGYNGGNFCQGNGVYRNYTTYTCNNPGTAQSFCSSSTNALLQQTCSNNQTCGNGSCTNNGTVACSTNSQCGTNGVVGGPFCQGNSVYQNYTTYTCNNAGTTNSYCSSNTVAQQQSTCSGTQTCSNGSCNATGTIACSSNSQCGTDADTGGNFCQGNGVYRNHTSYICNNPGTTNSYCSTNTTAQLQNTCSGSQTCSNGTCNNTNTGTVTCSSNSQCGSNGVTGANFCSGNSVYQNYVTYTCNNPGTTNSYCSSNTIQQVQTTCNGNQTCSNGTCNNTNTGTVACSSNSQCGSSGLIGGAFCQNSGVYQNYVTYTCNNAGTTSSYCSSNTTSQLQTTCSGSQTCSNGSCATVGNTCTSHSTYRCSGNNVYWFDSCGNQQEVYQTCNSGQVCSNNTCVTSGQTQGNLRVTTQVRNLSAGILTWGSTVNANPSDILEIQVTLQNTGNQAINNVIVRDTLPSTLLYYNNVTVDGLSNNGSVISGLSLGSINAGQTRTVTYQVQVAGAGSFPYGNTTVNNSLTITSSEGGTSNSSISVYVNRSLLTGAVGAPTGWSDDLFGNSLFIPLVLLAILGLVATSTWLKKPRVPAWVRRGVSK